MIQGFERIAPFLTHPLVLIGFVVLLFFAMVKALLKAGIIPPLPRTTGGRIVQSLLQYGFVIALVVIVLGFALEAYRVSRGAPESQRTVPKLLGMSPESAVLEAEASGLKISLPKRRVERLEEAGIIVSQTPLAGTQVSRNERITAFVGTAEVEIDFTNREEGTIKAESFKEKGITFKIVGDTQSCGEAVLEVQYHKLLGSYLAPTSVGDFGLSCAHLQIDISFPKPVVEVSVQTHGELGTMELWALNKDGNSIGRRLSTEVFGEHTKRLSIGSPDGNASIHRAYFYGHENTLIYSLIVKR